MAVGAESEYCLPLVSKGGDSVFQLSGCVDILVFLDIAVETKYILVRKILTGKFLAKRIYQ